MDEKIEMLYELCDTISREIEKSNDKIRSAGGELSAGDIDYLDKLTHSLKSIKTTIAMMEAEDEDGGYSERGYSRNMDGGSSYRSGRSYRDGRTYPHMGGSYARGRGRNARRDSMGRYSSHDGVAEELRSLMGSVQDESVRRDMQRLVEKVEGM